MIETKDFLYMIHGNDHINFRVIKSGDTKNLNGYYNHYTIEQLRSFNDQGYNIYFVVNGGGTKKEQINKINAVFIDFDCGKDKDKSYFPLERTKEYKNEKLKVLRDFSLTPSFIVETRNGLHVYWLLNDGATTQEFEHCQEKLINCFKSDEAVKTHERLMRLPGYNWVKVKDNPFMCNILEINNVRYDIKRIIDLLPNIEFVPSQKSGKGVQNSAQGKSIRSSDTNYNIQAIKELNVQYMKSVVSDIEGVFVGKIKEHNNTFFYHSDKTQKYIATTRMEVYDIINRINLADFLGIHNPKNFKCIIHDDNNPSAGIISGDDGSDIYICKSSNCGFVGGIIKVVEKLARCNKPTAINFIKDVYGIELLQSDWQKEQINLLEINKEYLMSGKMEFEYPQLWKYVKPRVGKLICLIDLAIKNCYGEELSYNSKPVFFASTTHLQTIFETSSKDTVSNNINLFALLNIIEKLPEEDIPENMLKKAKHITASKGYKKLPNHFTIPSYDTNTLEQSENNAIILKENIFSMRGISREWVLRTFGIELANKIYPQYKFENERGTSKKSNEKTNMIGLAINALVKDKGYVREDEIVEIFKREYGKTKTEKQIKRSLQEILSTYGLKRIRANNKIKEQFRIVNNGYPFLIVKQEEINK